MEVIDDENDGFIASSTVGPAGTTDRWPVLAKTEGDGFIRGGGKVAGSTNQPAFITK